jgi:hypothetical protein|tara:strand:+ start:224 stop:580 length:357 start_codon:yes stop_codon:yes gene_type:complete
MNYFSRTCNYILLAVTLSGCASATIPGNSNLKIDVEYLEAIGTRNDKPNHYVFLNDTRTKKTYHMYDSFTDGFVPEDEFIDGIIETETGKRLDIDELSDKIKKELTDKFIAAQKEFSR